MHSDESGWCLFAHSWKIDKSSSLGIHILVNRLGIMSFLPPLKRASFILQTCNPYPEGDAAAADMAGAVDVARAIFYGSRLIELVQ